MGDRPAAERACKDPNPIIDGRKANVNLAILGAKPRGNLQASKFVQQYANAYSMNMNCAKYLGQTRQLLVFGLLSLKRFYFDWCLGVNFSVKFTLNYCFGILVFLIFTYQWIQKEFELSRTF